MYDGFIKIPENGNYVFSILSNNESKLIIDDKIIIQKERRYKLEEESGIVALSEGMHSIKIYYVGSPFMKKLDLALSIASPRIKKQEIPSEWLFHAEGE